MARIIVADDHPIFLKGLVEVLIDAGHDVVGQAKDGEHLIELVKEHKPELAILDIGMPVLDGLAVLRRARDEKIACLFVVLSLHAEKATVKAALSLGARAYVLKGNGVDEVLDATRAVLEGKEWTSPSGPPTSADADASEKLDTLTPAELRVLVHLADNLTSPQIAEKLGLSVRTVQNHRAHVCEKLMLSGTHRLLQLALENKDRIQALLRAQGAAS
jgi:two-component system nitrate/nitrite response regulator NarL